MPVRDFPKLPPGSFWTGHLRSMQRDVYGFYRDHHRTYGAWLKFNAIPGLPFYSLAHPTAFEHILVKARGTYSRGRRWRSIVARIGGNGLVSSDGETWRRHRQAIAGFFNAPAVERYVATIATQTHGLVDRWQAAAPDTPVDISAALMDLGLRIVGATLFDDDLQQSSTAFTAAMIEGFAHIQQAIVDPFAAPAWMPTARNRRLWAANRQINATIVPLLAGAAPGASGSLLTALKRDERMSTSARRDEIATLLIAGHDTTATALAWAWQLLAVAPDVCARMQEEVDRVIGARAPTAADLPQLVFTRQVVDETLRLYPSVWAMHRLAHAADEIDGYPIRRGCSIALPIFVVHRDAAYWPDPDRFDPDRFGPALASQRPRYSYLPFGAGARVCVGGLFAVTEAVLVLAILSRFFTPHVVDVDIKPAVAFTLKPERPIVGPLRRRRQA